MTPIVSNRMSLPTSEDVFRAVAYLAISAWAILFWCFPPTAFTENVAFGYLLLWLIPTALGGVVSAFGVLIGFDLKVELPGLLIAIIGPFFYHISQVYYVVVPGIIEDPTQRIALAAYSVIPALLLLPRITVLMKEASKLRALAESRTRQIAKNKGLR